MTAQSCEKLIYEGHLTYMAAEPLNPYLCKLNNIEFISCNTACWRGYYGTWEIINDMLYLNGLSGTAAITDMEALAIEKKRLKQMVKAGEISPIENGHQLKDIRQKLTKISEVTLQTLFPGQDKVFASWVHGQIRIPRGKLLHYVHMGYESVYEKDLILSFRDGIITGKTMVENVVDLGD